MKYSITLAATISLLVLSPAIAQPSSNSQNPDPYGYRGFTPSMAIIIAVLIVALFFMVFFSIYIRQCQAQGGSGVGTGNGVAGRSRRAARGLDASVIATFPTMEYSEVKGLKIGKGALECAVCICEFENDETLRLIPKCDHVFHPECIDAWLESHTTCPVCRANLVPDPAEPADQANPESTDIEAQTGTTEPAETERTARELEPVEHEVLEVGKTLNRNRTRGGSRSSRLKRLFPRSHSTGHSPLQLGENTERFTLRLPVEVRKGFLNRQLQRASSMVVLPREGSSRRGYRTGEGSSRGGRYGRRLDRTTKSDRWVFSMAPLFFGRISSMKSPKVAANNGVEGSSEGIVELNVPRGDSDRPPV